MLYLTGVTNSFCLDWFIRGRVSTTLNMFYLYQLPVPRLTAADAAFGPIVLRAAQLICTTPEFDELAREVAFGVPPSGGPASENSQRTASPNTRPAKAGTPNLGVTAPAARAQLRAELDSLIAHLYALTESEFAHILTTFPLVAQPVKDAALEAWHAVTNGGLK